MTAACPSSWAATTPGGGIRRRRGGGGPAEGEAARPALGRRARRHEHAGDVAERERSRHAARCPAWTGAVGARADRRVHPEGPAARPVLIGLRNLDEREKVLVRDSQVHVFTMKDIDRQGIASVVEQAIAIAGRTRGHPCLVRPGRLRPGNRAGRRHAGQGRPRLPRGARRDGDGRRLRPADVARPRRGQPHPAICRTRRPSWASSWSPPPWARRSSEEFRGSRRNTLRGGTEASASFGDSGAAADAQPAAAEHHTMNARPSRCPHGEGASTACRICRRRRTALDGRTLDLFVGGVLGGIGWRPASRHDGEPRPRPRLRRRGSHRRRADGPRPRPRRASPARWHAALAAATVLHTQDKIQFSVVWAASSVVEHLTFNQGVASSILARPTT